MPIAMIGTATEIMNFSQHNVLHKHTSEGHQLEGLISKAVYNGHVLNSDLKLCLRLHFSPLRNGL